jgi:C4-dicarboxylate-specific signal transduction histidine kinase
LGLSISRKGVEANGGTLSTRNVANSGCVFTIDLPEKEGRPVHLRRAEDRVA